MSEICNNELINKMKIGDRFVKIFFDVLKMHTTATYKCAYCNKKRTKIIRVEHTVNPFNTNDDGMPKTREEVAQDVKKECNEIRKDLENGETYCTKCRPNK